MNRNKRFSQGVVNTANELNRTRMITNYENGRYHDKGLNSINNMENMNVEYIERENERMDKHEKKKEEREHRKKKNSSITEL